MKSSAFCYTIFAVLTTPVASLAGDAIEVHVSIADAEVAPKSETRQALVPSDLEYAIEIDMRCERQGSPLSLSLGVADTRHNFELGEDAEHLTASFVIPGQQLAPLVTQGYCVIDDPDSQTTILVKDAFTAQLSLRCQAGDSSSVVYLSQPLSVRLKCTLPDQDSESSASDADK